MRCVDDLQTEFPGSGGSPFAAVRERVDWSIDCGVISPKVRRLFFYEFTEDGSLVERANRIYPTFAHVDSAGDYTSVWKPDMTRGAAGHFANCSLPPNVVWFGNCAEH